MSNNLNDKLDLNIVRCFLEEASELIEKFEQVLLDIDKSPSQSELIDRLFRIMHNMKGSSKSAGLLAINQLAHNIENVLQNIRNKKIAANRHVCDVLLKSSDFLKSYIVGLKVDIEFSLDTSFIEKELKFINTASISGATSANEKKLLGTLPGEQRVTTNEQSSLSVIPTAASTALSSETSGEQDNASTSFSAANKVLDISKTEELKENSSLISNTSNPLGEEENKQIKIDTNDLLSTQQKGIKSQEEQIRVALWRLDSLINFIGELIIYQSMIKERCFQLGVDDGQLTDAISYMGKVVREIQDISLSLRMVPLKNIFTKIKRTARTTSEMLNKKINFVMEGEDVELDKMVVDMIGDPLIHLVRNALDHGIESPEDRIRKGKSEEGTLLLKAEQKEGNVHITVQDDGAGINREKVLSKAVHKKLITAKKSEDITNEELLSILTHPGFSTKDDVSEISGRGVGLDVVQSAIEELKGSCHLETRPNEGSTFYVNIPLTLSIIEGMVIFLDDIRYVIPMSQLLETINNSKYVSVSSTGKGKMINLRGEIVPILDLSRMVHGSSSRGNNNHDFSGLVVGYGGRKVSLEVSSIVTQQQVVIKNLGKELRDIPGIVGGFILGDGEAGIILNLLEIIKYNVHLLERGFEKVIN